MTQAEAAKRLGTTQQAYAKYEAGVSLPGLEKLYGFCELFNVSADWLLGLGSDVGVRLENSHHNAVNSDNANIQVDSPSCRDCPHLLRLIDILERQGGALSTANVSH